MCGILFCAGTAPAEPDAAVTVLANRGPDGTRQTNDSAFHTTFTRLAIVGDSATKTGDWTTPPDVSAGLQPLGRGEWEVLCNGEIYNYKELCPSDVQLRTDVEVLATLMTRDPDLLTWLPTVNGEFAGVLFNRETKQFFLFRDPLGVRPLYVGRAAADAASPIIAAGSLKAAVATVAAVTHIEEFPPGHVYDSRSNTIVPFVSVASATVAETEAAPLTDHHLRMVKDGIHDTLMDAVRKRLLHSNIPVAFLCSGGVDSSILLALGLHVWTAELNRNAKDLHAFTLQYDTGLSPDTLYATRLCEALGVSHTVFRFTRSEIETHLDEIIAAVETDDHRTLRAAVPQWFLARAIKTHTPFRVILSGEGADELFLGYNYTNRCPSAAAAEAESRRLCANIHRYDVLRAERAMSAWGLELRVPFLDSRVVQFVQSVSGGLRCVPGEEKQLLRDSYQMLRGLKASGVLDRAKEKFSDGCGFDYVPALMRIIAEREGGDPSMSAHLLEPFEKSYAKRRFAELFPPERIQIPSNGDSREMPEWAASTAGEGIGLSDADADATPDLSWLAGALESVQDLSLHARF